MPGEIAPFRIRPASSFVLAHSGVLIAAVAVVVLIGITGAGTEDQPGLLASLCVVVGLFVIVGILVAYAGWRLTVEVDGTRLVVRGLRTKSVELSKVESVAWQGWIDEAVVLTERRTGDRRRHRVSIPINTDLLFGVIEVPAWSDEDAQRLLRTIFDALPSDVGFNARAVAPFSAAGCRLARVT